MLFSFLVIRVKTNSALLVVNARKYRFYSNYKTSKCLRYNILVFQGNSSRHNICDMNQHKNSSTPLLSCNLSLHTCSTEKLMSLLCSLFISVFSRLNQTKSTQFGAHRPLTSCVFRRNVLYKFKQDR